MSESRPQKRSALVLYGTETGNSQEVAEELAILLERLHFVTLLSELDKFKPVRSKNTPLTNAQKA